MFRLEYEISLNESGRPCIDLPEDYEHRVEDRFFAMEVTRYILQAVYIRRSSELDENTVNAIDTTINFLGQISDEVAEILWKQMRNGGDIALLLDNKYHIQVSSIEERNALNMNFIYYNNKIFKRQEGLMVLVTDEMKIYELKDGISNENWISHDEK
jgi:hypothetical protein